MLSWFWNLIQTNPSSDATGSQENLETAKLQEIKNVQQDGQNSSASATGVEENSSEKFKSFFQEIERFINYIKNNEDLKDYIYKYPQ